MKKSKSFLSVFFILMLIISTMSVSIASTLNEVNQLTKNPPIEDFSSGIILFGAKPPKSSASIHDLSTSSYNYQAKDMGYRLYTDKWIKGSTSITISVIDWKLLESYGGIDNKLTLRVYDSSNKQVASKTITVNSDTSTTIKGLSSSQKYYVCFEVPTNNNRYSFYGSIKK